MKMIILHEKYTNDPIFIRPDAIYMIRKIVSIDNTTEVVTVSLGNHSIDVSEDFTTIMDKIKALEQTELNPSYNSIKSELDQQSSECTEHPCLGKLCRYYKQPCEDAISRQAVIDFIIDNYGLKCSSLTNGIRDYLPSVTPQIESSEDCISREDAVELIAGADETDGNEPVFRGKQVIEILKGLPPVTRQPKTGRCKDCKYFEYDTVAKEEAIKELKTRYLTMSQCLNKEDLHKANEALDMAIKALKELAIAKEFIRWVDHFALDVFTDEKYENALTDAIIEGLSTYKNKLEELRGESDEE